MTRTWADEADVNLTASVTDVRQTTGLADYAGELEARIPLTITDKSSIPSTGGQGPGTTQQFDFSFAVPCTETLDTTIGADCTLATSADTVFPVPSPRNSARSWSWARSPSMTAGTTPTATPPQTTRRSWCRGYLRPSCPPYYSPQPGGFEGLFTGRVLVATRDLSVADCHDVSDDLIRFDTAELGASAESFNRDHRIPTGVDQFHRLHPVPVEHVDPVLEPCPHGVLAMDRTGLVGSTLDCPVDDIVGEMLHVPIKPSTGKRLIGRLHHLYVLPRHLRAVSRQRKTPAGAGVLEERMMGFEPTTFCMASRRSSQLSYIRASGGL